MYRTSIDIDTDIYIEREIEWCICIYTCIYLYVHIHTSIYIHNGHLMDEKITMVRTRQHPLVLAGSYAIQFYTYKSYIYMYIYECVYQLNIRQLCIRMHSHASACNHMHLSHIHGTHMHTRASSMHPNGNTRHIAWKNTSDEKTNSPWHEIVMVFRGNKSSQAA